MSEYVYSPFTYLLEPNVSSVNCAWAPKGLELLLMMVLAGISLYKLLMYKVADCSLSQMAGLIREASLTSRTSEQANKLNKRAPER